MTMTTICVVTYSTPDWDTLCGLTDPNHLAYCDKHGYVYRNIRDTSQYPSTYYRRHFFFHALMLQGLFDWLFICDADFIFTNSSLSLERLIQVSDEIIMAKDAHGLQAGAMLVRCSVRCAAFFKRVIQQEPRYRLPKYTDQDAMSEALSLPMFRDLVRFVPQRQLQSYDYGLLRSLGGNYASAVDADGNDGQWRNGDFGFHCPGILMNDKIKALGRRL